MASKDDKRAAFLAATMSSERPLDALLPELTPSASASMPRSAVHPRVLESEVEGRREWGLIVWDDPGGPRRLHTAVQGLVEATLLAELSKPPRVRKEESERRFDAMRLFVFASPSWSIEPAIRAFGFREVPFDAASAEERMAAIRSEGRAQGRTVPAAPVSVWEARIGHREGALGDQLSSIEAAMAERMGDDVWGLTPGGPSKLFAMLAESTFGERIAPSLAGLESLEMLLVSREPDVIRWMPPLLFQALCDFLPIVAQATFETRISWAVCEELEGGFAQPPLIRVEPPGERPIHVPLGPHVLRWCMMPLHAGERVDSLRTWVEHQFGGAGEG